MKRVAIGEMGDFVVCSERARSQTPPVPPRTVYSHRLLAPPPPTNLHRLLFHLLHDLLPWSTGAVFWHHLLLPSTRTASSRLLLAPSLPAASSRRFLAPSPSAASCFLAPSLPAPAPLDVAARYTAARSAAVRAPHPPPPETATESPAPTEPPKGMHSNGHSLSQPHSKHGKEKDCGTNILSHLPSTLIGCLSAECARFSRHGSRQLP